MMEFRCQVESRSFQIKYNSSFGELRN